MDAHVFGFVYSRLFAHLPVLDDDVSLTLYYIHHLYFLKLSLACSITLSFYSLPRKYVTRKCIL